MAFNILYIIRISCIRTDTESLFGGACENFRGKKTAA